MKLTDTHRIILAAAGGRSNAALMPLPKGLKLATEERSALFKGLLKAGYAEERPAADGAAPWRTDESSGPQILVATAVGLAAVGIEPGGEANAETASRTRKPSKTKPVAKEKTESTKLDLLVGALRSRKGATIDELMKLTGWQAHSVRGAISGALKKRLGLKVLSEAIDGKSRTYRIETRASK